MYPSLLAVVLDRVHSKRDLLHIYAGVIFNAIGQTLHLIKLHLIKLHLLSPLSISSKPTSHSPQPSTGLLRPDISSRDTCHNTHQAEPASQKSPSEHLS